MVLIIFFSILGHHKPVEKIERLPKKVQHELDCIKQQYLQPV